MLVAALLGAVIAVLVWWGDWILLPVKLGFTSTLYECHVAVVFLLMPLAGAIFATRAETTRTACWGIFAGVAGYWIAWQVTRFFTEGQGRLSLAEFGRFYGDGVLFAVVYLAIASLAPIPWRRFISRHKSVFLSRQ
jgi:hypothetical protein